MDRDLAIKSFLVQSQLSDANPNRLLLTPADGAGLLLYLCAGPRAALDVAHHLPRHAFWGRVTRHLEAIVEGQTRDTEPPIAATGE